MTLPPSFHFSYNLKWYHLRLPPKTDRMVRFTHNEIPTPSDPPGSFGFALEAARQARDYMCSIYSQYPKRFLEDSTPTNPGREWARGAINDICRNASTPLPPAPTPPFNGGQCPCVSYLITYQLRSFPTADWTPNLTTTRNGRIIGFVVTPFGGQRLHQVTWVPCSGGIEQPPVTDTYNVDGSQSETRLIGITRVDGLPDTCGNPPAQYPPELAGDPPIPIPPIQFEPPTPDGPGNNLNITVPFAYINANGSINVDVGGVNFNFDIGGVEFNIENNFGNGEPGSGGGEPPDLSEIVNLLEETKEVAEEAREEAAFAREQAESARKGIDDAASNDGEHPQNDPNQQDKNQKDEDDPKEEDALERLLAVEVELTQMPENRREQDGGDAPNVVYAGWFEFKTKGTPHPRNPIHFQRNYFIAPVGADGYAYTVYNGFRAKATVITAKATP